VPQAGLCAGSHCKADPYRDQETQPLSQYA
jgi:hypothetical protein